MTYLVTEQGLLVRAAGDEARVASPAEARAFYQRRIDLAQTERARMYWQRLLAQADKGENN